MTEHNDMELPRPTGPYAVGRRAVDWTDPGRQDPYADDGSPRDLPVTIWYPAEPTDAEPAKYLPEGFLVHAVAFGVATASGIVTHSVEDAPVVAGNDRFPVLVFSPAGWAPYFYGAMLEELASHGYIVVGVQHVHEMVPATIMADGDWRWFKPDAVGGALTVSTQAHADDVRERGAVIDVKAEDLRAVLDRLAEIDRAGDDPLAGRLDLDRAGAFGHSFGGGAAVVAAQRDDRFRAVANLDGAMWRSAHECELDRPVLLLLAEHPEMTEPCRVAVEDDRLYSSVEYCEADRTFHRAAWQRLVDAGRPGVCAQIIGAEHRTFMDWRLLELRPWSIGRMGAATIDGTRMWEATTRALLSLFEPFVRGALAPTIADVAADVPQLVVTTPAIALAPVPASAPARSDVVVPEAAVAV
jgi:dienelactone hydrolase